MRSLADAQVLQRRLTTGQAHANFPQGLQLRDLTKQHRHEPTNCPQQVNPLAFRSAECCLTARANSPRENSCKSCENTLHDWVPSKNHARRKEDQLKDVLDRWMGIHSVAEGRI